MAIRRLTVCPGDEHFSKYAIGSYGFDSWACTDTYLSRRRTFIDVGAHIGHFTYHAMRRFKRVVAIEPVLLNFSCLRDNVSLRMDKLKNKPRMDLIHAAAGEIGMTGEVWYTDPSQGRNSGAWELSLTHNGGYPVKTEIVAVDDLGLDDVDLIKIDTQGWEERVLAGAAKTIRLCKPALIVEVVNDTNLNCGLIDKIRSMGYGQRALIQKNGIFLEEKKCAQ